MKQYVALFRGINVGGNNILPMAKLRELLTAMGLADVRSYIQSGNVVFRSEAGQTRAALSSQISAAIERDFGFAPRILLLERSELEAAMAANPYPEGEDEPKSLHLYFLTEPAGSPNLDLLRGQQLENERFTLQDQVFYLHAPDGIGRSKLATNVDRALGVATTARNWRTVSKLREMLGE
ncbi:MAG: DUF1697 domain-containing protein [Anaerolineales bacterium]|nr:DUF1697 domain-containing protein [Anaerolineales bacterium]MCB8960457.1 DUF1697 domain-containing protein [Ardenticatenales bacterium]